MKATNLLRLILLMSLLVIPVAPTTRPVRRATCQPAQWRAPEPAGLGLPSALGESGLAWHPLLVPAGHIRQRRNAAANRRRWQRRWQQWRRPRPPVSRRQRRQRQAAVARALLGWSPSVPIPAPPLRAAAGPAALAAVGASAAPPPRAAAAADAAAGPCPAVVAGGAPAAPPPRTAVTVGEPVLPEPAAPPPPAVDPLADLRQGRGWIDCVPEAELWERLRRVRWVHGLRCPHCGETAPTCLERLDPHYRGGLYRYRCLTCHLAGDAGEGGTFTDLTGTLFDGCRLDIRSLWLIVEAFVAQAAAVATSDEVQVNRHTVQRYFRLLRGAIYQARPTEPIALGPEQIVEGDEVYLTAGLKGEAGNQVLSRDPRPRGLKRRGRGTWDSDRIPILGLLCRGGAVRLVTLRNVQTVTIRPVIEQLVRQGARVYTDSYDIYHFLDQAGYQHATVNHSVGEYARGEVHCNTMECTWSWLRQAIRTYRGVSKVYLPLYVAQFEFFFNRRHTSRQSQLIDVLQVAFQADAQTLLATVDGAAFAEVCPVAG